MMSCVMYDLFVQMVVIVPQIHRFVREELLVVRHVLLPHVVLCVHHHHVVME